MLNVSHNSIARAHKVAIESPELAQQVREGKVKLNAAYNEVSGKSKPAPVPAPVREEPDPPLPRPTDTEYTAREMAAARAVLAKEISQADAWIEFELRSVQDIKIAVAKEIGYRQALEEKQTAVALAATAQERLEVAVKAERRRLEAEFEQRVRDEIKKRVDDIVLPSYLQKKEHYERVIAARNGVMSKETYRLILASLHPDRGASVETLNRAFLAFRNLELTLCSEKESPTQPWDLPRTYEEMLKRRAEFKAKRKEPKNSVAL
jgi:hypothetical protein